MDEGRKKKIDKTNEWKMDDGRKKEGKKKGRNKEIDRWKGWMDG